MSACNGKYAEELMATIKYLATPGKGLLAVDENTGTIGKRLASIDVENVEYNRQLLGELLFTAPNVAQYTSVVSLCLKKPSQLPPSFQTSGLKRGVVSKLSPYTIFKSWYQTGTTSILTTTTYNIHYNNSCLLPPPYFVQGKAPKWGHFWKGGV